MTAFNTQESSSLERKADVLGDAVATSESLLEYNYEIQKCALWLKEIKALKVCLQFPDVLLCDSVKVVFKIKKEIDIQAYILGDTSYGSCCVDEVAAQHVAADSIIHFGNACLSPTNRLPVLYIFEKHKFDVDAFELSFRQTFSNESKIVILFEVSYLHSMDQLSRLCKDYPNVIISTLTSMHNETCSKQFIRKLGREFVLLEDTNLSQYQILYIGQENRTLSNFFMDMDGATFYLYNPKHSDHQINPYEYQSSKFLMRRFYLVECVKDAKTLGIVIGTLGVSNYLGAVQRIKLLAKKTGKKCYIIAVGKPNVPKLANFPEIDVFVLIACPENSLLDSKEFYRPIVTPYDVELGLNSSREFSELYITDFTQLLPGGSIYTNLDSVAPLNTDDMSLINGKLRNLQPDKEREELVKNDAVALKCLTTVALNTGGQFLASRSWQGLEQNLGETEVTLAELGRSGIAQDYSELKP